MSAERWRAGMAFTDELCPVLRVHSLFLFCVNVILYFVAYLMGYQLLDAMYNNSAQYQSLDYGLCYG